MRLQSVLQDINISLDQLDALKLLIVRYEQAYRQERDKLDTLREDYHTLANENKSYEHILQKDDKVYKQMQEYLEITEKRFEGCCAKVKTLDESNCALRQELYTALTMIDELSADKPSIPERKRPKMRRNSCN